MIQKQKTKKNPKGAGAPDKYGEPTVSVGFRCPKSKVKEFREIGNKALNKWKRSSPKTNKPCLHDGKINQGHHADQPSWCDKCGEEL